MSLSVQTALALSPSPWFELRDGDSRGLALYERHYSAYRYADGRERKLFVGPGEKLVLLTHAIDALFVWRRFRDQCALAGDVNCAVFRREAGALASALIVAAEAFAFARWPRLTSFYTYVNARAIRSSNPGYCFLRAGYRRVGMTKGGHGRDPLIVLEKVTA